MIKSFSTSCILAALAPGALSNTANMGDREQSAQFMAYAASQNKHYGSKAEFGKRMANWMKNHAKVQHMNETHDDVEFSDNFMSDFSDEEFAEMLGLGKDKPDRMLGGTFGGQDEVDEALHEGRELQSGLINWRTLGKVSPVKNQGSCGSCWAFAAVLVEESKNAIQDGISPPVRLSEQQCVDCALAYAPYGHTNGCYGGWMMDCWQESKDYGLRSAATYPYTGVYGTCNRNVGSAASYAQNWAQISYTSATSELQNGPLAIAVGAGNSCWYWYSSGILTSSHGCPTNVDHAVVIVGKGQEPPTWKRKWVCRYQTTPCKSTKEDFMRVEDAMCHRRRDLQIEPYPYDYELEPYYPCWYRCCYYEWVMIPGKTYWLIQNSWGTGWGDNGLIKLQYEGGVGVSGMNQYIYWATVQ